MALPGPGPLAPPHVMLASLPVESFFYGVFLLLFCLSMALFFYRHKSQGRLQQGISTSSIRPVLVLSILIFITVTGHWVVGWVLYISSTIRRSDVASKSPISCETLKSIFVVPSVLLADSAFIYRLWIVWGNATNIIIFPCLTWIGLLVTGSNIIMAHVTLDVSQPESQKAFHSWILADILFTISTNVYCTVFISWKIWHVSKQAQCGSTVFSLQNVLSTVVESGAFYTSWMATAFGFNLAKSPIENIFIDANSAVAAISLMLINVRVGLGWAAMQSRTWRDAMYESQFRTDRGELRFALTQESPKSSALHSELSAGRNSTTERSERPSTI